MGSNRVIVVLSVMAMALLIVTPALGRGRPSQEARRGMEPTGPSPTMVSDEGADDRDVDDPAFADQTLDDDVIIDGSLCTGLDCVNGEAFGFDTVRLKENNLRITAVDTSNSASFPTQDWSLVFNDSSNGGANRFSIEALSPATARPFTIEAGSNTNALYVDDVGRVGLGTPNPATAVHTQSGNTPALRFDQSGTSGFSPQVWDVAGNESNFFVRDVTGDNRLPLRIRPGAPTNSLAITSTGDVGLGTASAASRLHVVEPTGPVEIRLQSVDGDTWRVINTETGGPGEGLTFTMRDDGLGGIRLTPEGALALPNPEPATLLPASPTAGTIFFDGDTFCGFDGTVWVPLQSGGTNEICE